jgi:hypothetical protein
LELKYLFLVKRAEECRWVYAGDRPIAEIGVVTKWIPLQRLKD